MFSEYFHNIIVLRRRLKDSSRAKHGDLPQMIQTHLPQVAHSHVEICPLSLILLVLLMDISVKAQ